MKKGIIISLILMSIGFAAVTTSLVINGTINYGYDSDEFDVIFSEAILDGEVKSDDLIEPNEKRSITFTTKELSKQGDRSILEYQVMNNSKQYNASVIIDCKRVDGEGNTAQSQESEYTTITPSPTSLTVKAQESRRGTITVELKKVSTKDIEEKFKCSLTVNPSEREEEGQKYIAEDSCKSAAAPNLENDNKLIPVTIDDSGNITKVSATNENWYDYCEKKWANAVILNDGEVAPEDNKPIDMNKIASMFVWIPKYKYRLWNVNVTNPLYTVHSIEIEFDKNDTEDVEGVSCETPMESGDTGNCDNGEYMTHPAFKSFGVDGFWVGKFETGYKDASNADAANQITGTSTDIVVKPDEYSWRGANIKTFFTAAKGYDANLDSHMMKNTEWGAVAYLSHSIFGINKEITINNNNQFKTGYAALSSTNQSKYPGEGGDGSNYNTKWNTTNGFTASTTGNTTGIYDMSGGSWEYMAAYVENTLGGSGFASESDGMDTLKKYFDVYKSDSNDTSYTNMILGDATGEMGPFKNFADSDNTNRYHNSWYMDSSYFVSSTQPWFNRGGSSADGYLGGQFHFSRRSGSDKSNSSNQNQSFRLVLAPSN